MAVSESMQHPVRNDGKARRMPRLGLLENHPRIATPPKPRVGAIQNWHELVSRGPVGSEARRKERREAVRHGKMLVLNTIEPNRAMRREAHGRGYNPGQLDQHRTRLQARGGGGIDRVATRVRRRAERLAAAA